ncbi:MAG: chemotaxis protein CheW [Deltaproteobacteria bacterium]|nr:chemotaxis protein CheW [Deltaproteobacteria bacterium]
MNRAADMRAAFDAAFARAPDEDAAAHLELLVVRAGAATFAIPQPQVAELHAHVRIVPVPTRCRELLGVAHVRGAIVPVYDLRAALEQATTAPPAWLLVLAGGRAAVAFDAFERHLRVPLGEAAAHSIIDLQAILARIAGTRTEEETT